MKLRLLAIAMLMTAPKLFAADAPIDIASHKKPIVVTCVGDSITAGEVTFPVGSSLFGSGTITRQIVVADTDAAALRLAEPAWRHYHDNLTYLWRMSTDDQLLIRQAVPSSATYEDSLKEGTIIAGSPSTVKDKIAAQVEELGINYMINYMMFGTLTLSDALRSMALFKNEVMPAFASK